MEQSKIERLEKIFGNTKYILIGLVFAFAVYAIVLGFRYNRIQKNITENDIITAATFEQYYRGSKGVRNIKFTYTVDFGVEKGNTAWAPADSGFVKGDKFLVVYSRAHPEVTKALRDSANFLIPFIDSTSFSKFRYKTK